MKPDRITCKLSYGALLLLGLSMALPSQLTVAATTDLANIPLVNATSVTVLPNLQFILDDSGSMARDYLPDNANGLRREENSHCNGVGYNPATTYIPPVTSTGASYPNATYPTPWTNGFNTGSGNASLNTPLYSTYTGTERDLDYTFSVGLPSSVITTTTFYTECNSDLLSVVIPLTTSSPTSTVVTGFTIAAAGINIVFATPTVASTNRDTIGQRVADAINLAQAGYVATYSTGSDQITIRTDITAAASRAVTINKSSGNMAFGAASFSTAAGKPGVGKFTLGTPVTAAQQQNYANWYSYYRTRMLMAKTSIGLAFKDVRGWPLDPVANPTDVNYFHARVGFTTINDKANPGNAATYLKMDEFNSAINTAAAPHNNNNQKLNFYTKLYAQNPGPSTPLRGALSKAGRLYAGKLSDDPIQYSCQKNYTILTTDGYWNKGDEATNFRALDMTGTGMAGAVIADLDGKAGVSRPSYDQVQSQGSLADIAYYYYHNDLRPGTCSPDKCTDNVRPSSSDENSKTADVAKHQHMTTFTVGLGLSGRLRYDPNYQTQTSGDYFDILNNLNGKKWSDPYTASNDDAVIERIDDLWHAAVTGRGTYLSAANAQQLEDGLKKAMGNMSQTLGGGAAAGTSSLNPVPGESSAYVATYVTGAWSGDVSAYNINLATGMPDLSVKLWSARDLLTARIKAPGDVEGPPARVIKTGSSDALSKDFAWASLSALEKSFLDNTKLSQYASWTAAQITAGTGSNMLNYLRGHYKHEQSIGTPQLYRQRQDATGRFVMGDISHAQPVYVRAPPYSFLDAGYAGYKAAQAGRAGAVYVSSNDGMLHAFHAYNPPDGASVAGLGEENWAYVPPMIMPNLWRLADENFIDNHIYTVDGPLAAADVNFGTTAAPDWRTVLMAAMGKGARGYFAMDVTDPATPKVLWSFTADPAFATVPGNTDYFDANIGYTYGVPLAAKLKDGKWVAVMTSGYNNVPEPASYTGGAAFGGDGKGYVFVLDIKTGKKIKTISTGTGSVASPSGLGKLNLFTENFTLDNTTEFAYAGDLLGNMWRFDLKDEPTPGTVSKLFAGVATQPITDSPEIGKVNNVKVVYFGTGRYLGQSDLADTSTQAIFAVKDADTPAAPAITTSTLQQQTQAIEKGAITGTAVDWGSKDGWYVNLKGAGERVAVDPQLHLGVLIFSSTTPPDPTDPNKAACVPGGSGAIYQMDWQSGGSIVTIPLISPPVGVAVVEIKNPPGGGESIKKITVLTGEGTLVTTNLEQNPLNTGSITAPTRVLWRELSN